MRAYSQLIEDSLVGETPKEKYDYLIALQNEISLNKAKIENCKVLLNGLIESEDSASLGNLKVFIEGTLKSIR